MKWPCAAAGELLAKTGKKCSVQKFEESSAGEQGQLRLPVEVRRALVDDSGARRGARAQGGAGGGSAGAATGCRASRPRPA